MPDDAQEREPTQETPAGHTIPVPTREQVFGDFEKLAKPPADPSERESGPEE